MFVFPTYENEQSFLFFFPTVFVCSSIKKCIHVFRPFSQAECVRPNGSIAHKDPHTMEETETESFLPKGEIVIGVTSGASTPDAYMEQVRFGSWSPLKSRYPGELSRERKGLTLFMRMLAHMVFLFFSFPTAKNKK